MAIGSFFSDPDKTRLGLALIEAARNGDEDGVALLLDTDVDVNFTHPDTGMTPLHYAAAYNAVGVVRQLTATGLCDATKIDHRVRVAASLAIEFGKNPAVSRYLYNLAYKQEVAQAAEKAAYHGIDQTADQPDELLSFDQLNPRDGPGSDSESNA